MPFFKKWTDRARQWAQKLSIKKRISIILAILLFLTPITIAILSVLETDKKNQEKNYLDLTLYDSKNQSLVSEAGYVDDLSLKSLLGMFYSIAQSKDPLSTLPVDQEDAPYVRAEITLNGKFSEWLCYFSLEDSGYCIAENGKAYVIHSTVNESFLASPYAEDFYPAAVPPTLFSVDNDPILPQKADWNYRNCHHQTLHANNPSTTAQTVLYEMSGEFSFYFSDMPDLCRVTVKDEDKLLFDGDLEKFSPMTVAPNTVLRVSIKAEWLPHPERQSSGTMEYQFSTRLHSHALFSVHTNTAVCGNLLLISCANVSNPAKIQLIDKNQVGLTIPAFYKDGDFVRALLLVPNTLPTNQLAFDIVYGATTKSFVLNVVPKEEPSSYFFLADEETIELAENAATISELLLKPLANAPETRPYFRGNFLNPTDLSLTAGYQHGNHLQLSADQTEPILALGSEFRANKSGTSIKSLQNGVVYLAGQCDLLGNYVVVDHGCGLFLWYAHLSSVDVQVGDVLKRGDLLGKSGTAGVCSGEGVLILASTKTSFINPSQLFGKEIPLSKFEEELNPQQ